MHNVSNHNLPTVIFPFVPCSSNALFVSMEAIKNAISSIIYAALCLSFHHHLLILHLALIAIIMPILYQKQGIVGEQLPLHEQLMVRVLKMG